MLLGRRHVLPDMPARTFGLDVDDFADRSQVQATSVKLEGSGQMTVLLRISERQVERVRVFSEDCQLDAGGRQVFWLDNVRPPDSIAYLESLVTGQADRRDRVVEGAISAIALHADAAADASLERLVARRTSLTTSGGEFHSGWAMRGARRGLDILAPDRQGGSQASRCARSQSSASRRARSPTPSRRSSPQRAANDQTAVRGEAIFWLGQKAGRKASAAITERIEQDPDTDVKKKAVFALSQLPKDEGVPLLINVARTHSNPAVRKQAMFWLGQSKDPRALEFFAEVLK